MQRNTLTTAAAMIMSFSFCLDAFAGNQAASNAAAENAGASQQQIPVPVPDITQDGKVDSSDLVRLMLDWGTCDDGFCRSDLNSDGFVDGRDLVALILNWT